MGIFDRFISFFTGRSSYLVTQGAKSSWPSATADNSDIIESIIHCNATHASKGQVLHVVVDDQGRTKNILRSSSYSKLFRQPNPYMTPRDFMYVMRRQAERTNTAMAYIEWDARMKPVEIWPIAYRKWEIQKIVDAPGYAVVFNDMDGIEHKMHLEDVVIVRNRYDGSGMSGSGMEAIEKVLELQNDVDEGVKDALTISNKIHGILHHKKAMLADESVKESQAAFVERMKDAARNGGIVVTDSMEEYQNIAITPYNTNAALTNLITGRLYAYYQTPLEVVNNTASEQVMQNYYSAVIEPWWIALAQALTNALFTRTQRDYGNKIMVYGSELAGASWQTKLNILDKVKETGDLTRNERREILGYAPVEGGDEFEVSLNFIKDSDQSAYQMQKMEDDVAQKEEDEQTDDQTDEQEEQDDAGEE